MNKPKIVCLCGSTKFKDIFLEIGKNETLKGNIVLIPFVYKEEMNINKSQKLLLDKLHKKKIDMSDEIFIVNKDNYIGESTRSEIEYAKKLNIKIRYLI